MSKIKIADFAEVITGGTPSTSNPEYWENGDVPWLQSGACQNDVITGCDTFITQKGLENSAAKMMKPDSVLIALTGATTGKVGYLTFEACANQSVTGIQPNERFVSKYLYYYLRGIRKKILDDSYGGAQKHISQGYVKNIEVPLGSIEEQKTITKLLESVDTTIALRQQELQLLDDLIKARFVELFGDPVLNQKGFPVYRMDEVVEFQGGSQPDKKYFEYQPTEDNIRLIQIRDYKTDNYITYIPKTMAKRFCTAEDIMIGRYGPPIFQILQGIEGSFNVALMKATPKMGNREFIRHFLKQDCLLHYLEGLSKRTAGQDGIQMDKLKAYPFPMPPVEAQEQFETFVKQVDKSKFAVQKALDEAQTLFDSLMQKCFG